MTQVLDKQYHLTLVQVVLLTVDNGFVNSGDVIVPLATILDANNIVKENNLTYSHANVFCNGVELINIIGEQKYTLTTNQVTITQC